MDKIERTTEFVVLTPHRALALLALVITVSMADCTPSIRYASEESINNQSAGNKTASNQHDSNEAVNSQPANNQPPDNQLAGNQPVDKHAEQTQAWRKNEKKGSQKKLEETVASYIGSPYKYGGTDKNGFDCSGFVTTIYREVYGVTGLPRTSSDMWRAGRQVPVTAARPGDIVFFKGNNFGAIGHVGIFMGGRRFAHSASSSGVIYSDLDETYYSRRFVGVRRIL